jgi:hypothetical protein
MEELLVSITDLAQVTCQHSVSSTLIGCGLDIQIGWNLHELGTGWEQTPHRLTAIGDI